MQQRMPKDFPSMYRVTELSGPHYSERWDCALDVFVYTDIHMYLYTLYCIHCIVYVDVFVYTDIHKYLRPK